MKFPFDLNLNINTGGITGINIKTITVNSGLTTLIGPNGSGKTQLLRAIKQILDSNEYKNSGRIRYVSSGRLGPLENYRTIDGSRTNIPNYDEAHLGSKHTIERRHQNETVVGDFNTLSVRPDILISNYWDG
ncbi:MAG: AAA family ATPase [Bacteroidota bacterium]